MAFSLKADLHGTICRLDLLKDLKIVRMRVYSILKSPSLR